MCYETQKKVIKNSTFQNPQQNQNFQQNQNPQLIQNFQQNQNRQLNQNLQQNQNQQLVKNSQQIHQNLPGNNPMPQANPVENPVKVQKKPGIKLGKVLLTRNHGFKNYLRELKRQDNNNDSEYMVDVRQKADELISAEKDVMDARDSVQVASRLEIAEIAKNNFIKSCLTYIQNRNYTFWKSDRGILRKRIVQGLLNIANKEMNTQSTDSIEQLITKNDEHKAYAESRDVSFDQFKYMYDTFMNIKDALTKKQKAVLSRVEEFYKLSVSMAAKNKRVEKGLELKAFLYESKEIFKGPFYEIFNGLRDTFNTMVGGGLVIPGMKNKSGNIPKGKIIERDGADADVYADIIDLKTEKEDRSLLDCAPGLKWKDVKNAPLFSKGLNYSDIGQGHLGNCYMLSTLASYARSDPKVIRDCMKDNGDGTVTVRFYRRATQKEKENYNYKKYVSKNRFGASDNVSKIKIAFYRLNVIKDEMEASKTKLKVDLKDQKKKAKAYANMWTGQINSLKSKGDKMTEDERRNLTLWQKNIKNDANEIAVLKRKLEDERNKLNKLETRLKDLNILLEDNKDFNYKGLESLVKKIMALDAGKSKDNRIIKYDENDISGITDYKELTMKICNSLVTLSDDQFKQLKIECKDEIEEAGKEAPKAPKFIPVYVTVTKEVPVDSGDDIYSKGSLWVQMLEKAYARSGLRNKEFYEYYNREKDVFDERHLNKIYKNLKKKYKNKKTPKQVLKMMENSYEVLSGGSSDEFAEALTGKEHKVNSYRKVNITSDILKMETRKGSVLDIFQKKLSAYFIKKQKEYFSIRQAEKSKQQKENNGNLQEEHNEIRQKKYNEIRDISSFPPVLYGRMDTIFLNCFKGLMNSVMNGDIPLLTIELVLNRFKKACDLELLKNYTGESISSEILDKALSEYMEHVEKWLENEEEMPSDIAIRHEAYTTKEDENGDVVGKYSDSVMAQFDKMKRATANNEVVQCGSIKFRSKAKSLNGEPVNAGFVGNHAYSVIDVDDSMEEDGFLYVILYNPHHANIRATKCITDLTGKRIYKHFKGKSVKDLSDAEKSGVFRMELNEFLVNCDAIYY